MDPLNPVKSSNNKFWVALAWETYPKINPDSSLVGAVANLIIFWLTRVKSTPGFWYTPFLTIKIWFMLFHIIDPLAAPGRVIGKSVLTPSAHTKSSRTMLFVYSGNNCRLKYVKTTESVEDGASTKVTLLSDKVCWDESGGNNFPFLITNTSPTFFV